MSAVFFHNTLRIPVVVLDANEHMYLIEPVHGEGEAWVNKGRVELDGSAPERRE